MVSMSLNEKQHRAPCLAFTLAAVELMRPGTVARRAAANIRHISSLVRSAEGRQTATSTCRTAGVLDHRCSHVSSAFYSPLRFVRPGSSSHEQRVVQAGSLVLPALEPRLNSGILRLSQHDGWCCVYGGCSSKAPGKHTARVRWGRGGRFTMSAQAGRHLQGQQRSENERITLRTHVRTRCQIHFQTWTCGLCIPDFGRAVLLY